jgi:hypothetical protein
MSAKRRQPCIMCTIMEGDLGNEFRKYIIEHSPSCETNLPQSVKKFREFCETRMPVWVLTVAHHVSLTWARWIQPTHSHRISLRHISILLSHLRFGLPGDCIPSDFTPNPSSPPFMPRATPTSSSSIWSSEYYLARSANRDTQSYADLRQSAVTYAFLHPNIFLSALFWNTVSRCFSLQVRDQVPHPYKATGKITVIYVSILIYLYSNGKTKGSGRNGRAALPQFNLLLISTCMQFWFAGALSKYMNFACIFSCFSICLHVVICPAFCSQDIIAHSAFSAFAYRPHSLQATSKASVFLIIVSFLLSNK